MMSYTDSMGGTSDLVVEKKGREKLLSEIDVVMKRVESLKKNVMDRIPVSSPTPRPRFTKVESKLFSPTEVRYCELSGEKIVYKIQSL